LGIHILGTRGLGWVAYLDLEDGTLDRKVPSFNPSNNLRNTKVNDTQTKIVNAVITHVNLERNDHGSLSSWIVLDYGGSGQGFGGYLLYSPTDPNILSFAGHWIWRIMQIAGVSSWNDVVGKTVRVKQRPDKVEAIRHIIKDDWFCPREEFILEKKQ
jgi:hypothetical protein